VLEVLKGDRDAVEIARAYDLHLPGTRSALREMEQLLGKKEVGIALLKNFMDGSSEPGRRWRS